jgi:hypothetical protein
VNPHDTTVLRLSAALRGALVYFLLTCSFYDLFPFIGSHVQIQSSDIMAKVLIPELFLAAFSFSKI